MHVPARDDRRQEGVALLVTVVLILMMALMVLTSIGHSGDEAIAGGRARSSKRALYAADGGMQMALSRIAGDPPVTAPINTTIDNLTVQSRTRAQTTPQNLASLGTGPPPEGYGVNTGAGYASELFRADVTSLGPTGSTAELQTKMYRFTGSTAGY